MINETKIQYGRVNDKIYEKLKELKDRYTSIDKVRNVNSGELLYYQAEIAIIDAINDLNERLKLKEGII